MTISKPDELIKFRYYNNGNYCSIGWLAKEAGVTDQELISCGVSINQFDELMTKLCKHYGLTEDEVEELQLEQDTKPDTMGVFLNFCERNNIQFKDLSTKDLSTKDLSTKDLSTKDLRALALKKARNVAKAYYKFRLPNKNGKKCLCAAGVLYDTLGCEWEKHPDCYKLLDIDKYQIGKIFGINEAVVVWKNDRTDKSPYMILKEAFNA